MMKEIFLFQSLLWQGRGSACRWLFIGVLSMLHLIGQPGAARGRSLEAIRSSGELRVCFSDIHPSLAVAGPSGCREDCRFSGPAPEAADAFAQFLGDGIRVRGLLVRWEEQFYNSAGLVDREAAYTPHLLESGQCDLYPNNMSRLPWRLTKLDIATMFTNRLMVLVNQDRRERFRGVEDLAGKVAAVEKETSYHSWMEEQNRGPFSSNPIQIRLMDTVEALSAMETGGVDFTIIDADAAFWFIRHRLPGIHMAFPVGPPDELGWAMRKDDRDLRDAVHAFFTSQRQEDDSALNRIWTRYFGMTLNHFIGLLGSIQN